MSQIFRFENAVIDTRTERVIVDGRTLALEPRTFDVLLHLVRHRGEVVRHNELLDTVWGQTNVTAHSLTQAISQLRRALDDRSDSPRFIRTVHRRGYEWVAPVEVLDVPSTDAEGTASRWKVPPRLVSLIGRDELVRSVGELLSEFRIVTLMGPGGVGKTQLALEVARRAESSFADGALLVDMSSETEGVGVSLALARAIRMEAAATVASLQVALRDRNALLLFDNCEHVAGAVGALATDLISVCTGLHVLITTQASVGIATQRMIRVDPLGNPDAVQLFVERARTINPDFALAADNEEHVEEICSRLDGIPLAVELAAARMNVLTPAQVAARLDERFALLTTSGLSAAQRHQTLLAAINWSVSLLSPGAQRLLTRMAVFAGGWTIDAAEAVVGVDAADALVDEISHLVDTSLVTAAVRRPEARYKLLDSIRLFALDRLLASSEQALLRSRHLAYFRRFAALVESDAPGDPVRWLQRVREEHANLRDAVAWALSSPATANDALHLCCDLRWAWRLEGNYVESYDWLRNALSAAKDAPPSLLGKARIVLGLIQHHRGEHAESSRSIELGLSQLASDERWERGFGSLLLAYVETMAGNLEKGDTLAQSLEHEIEELADDQLLGFARMRAGVGAGMRGELDQSIRLLTEAGGYLRRGRDAFLFIFSELQLGLQCFLAGDFVNSRAAAVASLRAAYELDNVRAIAGTIELLAYLALAQDDLRWACRLLGAASRLRNITAAPMLANFRGAHDRARATVAERLGTDALAREMRAGAETPLDDVVLPLLS